MYQPRIARFNSVDPLTKKFPWYTSYQFAGNQPIASIDLDGLEEYHAMDGSLIGKYGTSTEIRVVYNSYIKTANLLLNNIVPGGDALNQTLYNSGSAGVFRDNDKMAADWGNRYNAPSINTNKEMASNIFFVQINGKNYGTYEEPTIDQGASNMAIIPPNTKVTIHSHAAFDPRYDNNNFSTTNGDISIYNALGITGYITTPDGSLKKYNPTTKTQSTISTSMPSDPNDPNRQNSIPPIAKPQEADPIVPPLAPSK